MPSSTDVISADSAVAIELCANIELRCRGAVVDTACRELPAACIGDNATAEGEVIPNFDKSSSE